MLQLQKLIQIFLLSMSMLIVVQCDLLDENDSIKKPKEILLEPNPYTRGRVFRDSGRNYFAHDDKILNLIQVV